MRFTICTECEHFVNKEPDTHRKDIWYNHFCLAHPLPIEIDPYDGKPKSASHNSLGMKHFTDRPLGYCRDFNHGDCKEFEPFKKPENATINEE